MVSVDVPVTVADAVLTARLTVPRRPRGVVLVLGAPGVPPSAATPRPQPGPARPQAALAAPGPASAGLAAALLDGGFAVLDAELRRPGRQRGRPIAADEIAGLTERLVVLSRWTRHGERVAGLPLGYFASGPAAAVALRAAAELDGEVAAVVSTHGRPDLVGSRVTSVTAATLLIVGGADPVALDRNCGVEPLLRCPSSLEILAGASHRLTEPGVPDQVVDLSLAWFRRFLRSRWETITVRHW